MLQDQQLTDLPAILCPGEALTRRWPWSHLSPSRASALNTGSFFCQSLPIHNLNPAEEKLLSDPLCALCFPLQKHGGIRRCFPITFCCLCPHPACKLWALLGCRPGTEHNTPALGHSSVSLGLLLG